MFEGYSGFLFVAVHQMESIMLEAAIVDMISYKITLTSPMHL